MSLAELLPVDLPSIDASVNPISEDLRKVKTLLDRLAGLHPDSQYAKEWRDTSSVISTALLCYDRRTQAQALLRGIRATAAILRWNLIYKQEPPLSQNEEIDVHQLLFACSYDLYLMAVGLDFPI